MPAASTLAGDFVVIKARERGEILPPDFVPEFQIEIWMANGDIAALDNAGTEENA